MAKRNIYFTVWSLVIILNFYFIYNFTLRHFNVTSINKPFGSLLITHISFGMIAIITGPLQFFPVIRKKYVSLHRMIGRIYLLSVLVAAISSIVLAISHNIIEQHRIVFGTGLLGLATAWLLTSGMAFWSIMKRNFDQHREWMIKSYVVTCGFTTFRIFAATLNGYMHIDQKDMGGIMAWACWSVPLLITEVILQAIKLSKPYTLSKARL